MFGVAPNFREAILRSRKKRNMQVEYHEEIDEDGILEVEQVAVRLQKKESILLNKSIAKQMN